MTTFTPIPDPIANSVVASALTALLPLVLFFVLLGIFRINTHISALVALAVGAVVGWWGFGMPLPMIGLAALQGVAFSFFPIISIIIAAVWLYNLSEQSGRADDLRTVFDLVGRGDKRMQAFIISFAFCGLLEGLAGFGSPVVIVAAMLVTIGIPPMKAALAAIMGNTISLGFGAMGIPITTGAMLGGLAAGDVAVAMGYITPWVVIVIPSILVIIIDGLRGLKDMWPASLLAGAMTGVSHWWCANYFSYELTVVVASLVGFVSVMILLLMWQPSTPDEWYSPLEEPISFSRGVLALMPYWLVSVVFAVAKLWTVGIDIPALLKRTTIVFPWPGLHGRLLTPDGEVSRATMFTIDTLAAPATLIAITAAIVTLVYTLTSSGGRFPMTIKQGLRALGDSIVNRASLFATIAIVMALAYVMNFSGQTASIGYFLAGTGSLFIILSPILGWIGTAGTGSATSANALFADLQATAAQHIGSDPALLVGANTIAGEIGKVVSPQNLAIAASAINEKNRESDILRRVFPWSLGLLVLLCVVIGAGGAGWLPGL